MDTVGYIFTPMNFRGSWVAWEVYGEVGARSNYVNKVLIYEIL